MSYSNIPTKKYISVLYGIVFVEQSSFIVDHGETKEIGKGDNIG